MSIKNANIGYYHNDLIYLISIVLMILGATSFLAHYKIIKTKGKSLIQDLQFKTLICIITFVTIILYLASHIVPIDLLFTVTSSITTTGANVQLASTMAGWPSFILVILMILILWFFVIKLQLRKRNRKNRELYNIIPCHHCNNLDYILFLWISTIRQFI